MKRGPAAPILAHMQYAAHIVFHIPFPPTGKPGAPRHA